MALSRRMETRDLVYSFVDRELGRLQMMQELTELSSELTTQKNHVRLLVGVVSVASLPPSLSSLFSPSLLSFSLSRLLLCLNSFYLCCLSSGTS